ncbi:FkbM family methyltransferase [Psychroserpens sp. SPM9]|uniref:FkbM family methyltransferase n=1 Tax=Psychroserpens sp. SPM9 TaxID=2975598 RepID=UPI0021A3C2B0|nr:FkbM family methyltransferase [Psychroserpens sp. SPM9]MDG5490033.1 FkbM family methyltransferase [Psychroserpens sp. SPM9]
MLRHIKTVISILKEREHPLKIIWAYVLLRTGLNRYVKIKQNGYKINLSQSNLAITLFGNKNYGHEDEGFLRKTLKPNDTYIDVGANIGTLVLTGAICVGNEGKVIGIEAHPNTFNVLQANVNLNSFNNIKLINSAVGNEKGTLHFSDAKSDDSNKILLNSDEGVKVAVNTLDMLLKEIKHIDLLKIDVEGFEKQVFEGATQTLNKTSLIYFESFERNFTNYNYHTGDLIKLLNDSGFFVYKMINLQQLQLLDINYKSEICENLVATKHASSLENTYNFEII